MINIDRYRSGPFLYQSHRLCFKTTIMPSPDQYWSILIKIDQDFSYPKSQTLFQNNYYAESWSILININQYWSELSLTKSHTLFQDNYYAESWSILTNIDQYWSLLINIDRDFFNQSRRLCYKTVIMPSPDQYWSILINIDQYWSISIRTLSLPKPQTLFQNNYYAESWSILIYIDQYWSGLFLSKVTDSVSKQLLCRVLKNIDQY